MLNNFTVKKNKLYIGENSAESLIKRFGSPLYVYDASIIKQRFNDLTSNITYQKTKYYYACKANTNLEIIRLLKQQGSFIETVSPGEVFIALKAGFQVSEIAFTCSNLTSFELKWLIDKKITVNLDSLSQLKRWGEMSPNSSISIRINQGIGAAYHQHWITGGENSKFGIDISQLKEAKKIAKKYSLRINGIHQHIGSGILNERIFMKAMEKLMKTAIQFPELKFIDFGGGFGVRYTEKEEPLDMVSLGKKITKSLYAFMKEYGRELEVRFEPGKFLVAESGTLLATVVEIKRNPKKTFIGINAGMNQLIRQSMYGVYQEIVNASAVKGKKEVVSVTGNICESADFFAKDQLLRKFLEDDIVAILDSGAYGYSMSSAYNSRSQPAEVLVDGKSVRIIRKERGIF